MKTEVEILSIIKNIRLSKSITQIEMAELIGLSQSAYAKLEKGITALTYSRLIVIMKALGIRYNQLFDIEDIEKIKKVERLLLLSHELIDYKESKIRRLNLELEVLKQKP